MIQTVHEITDPFDVQTPLGYGVAMFLFVGSIHSNPSFLCKLYDTGELRVVDMRDIRVYGNPSAGEKLEPKSVEKSNDWIKVGNVGGLSVFDSSSNNNDWDNIKEGTYYKID